MKPQAFIDLFEKKQKGYSEKALTHSFNNSDFYALWLAQTYYFVCNSTRLLMAAASRFPIHEKEQFRRFLAHIKEEQGHEVLALNDIKRMNYDIKNLPELPQTKAFYLTQYALIQNTTPYALFGYILFLEDMAVRIGEQIAHRLPRNIKESSGSFLKVHSAEDVEHVKEALNIINEFDENTISKINESLEISAALYESILDGIEARVYANLSKAG